MAKIKTLSFEYNGKGRKVDVKFMGKLDCFVIDLPNDMASFYGKTFLKNANLRELEKDWHVFLDDFLAATTAVRKVLAVDIDVPIMPISGSCGLEARAGVFNETKIGDGGKARCSELPSSIPEEFLENTFWNFSHSVLVVDWTQEREDNLIKLLNVLGGMRKFIEINIDFEGLGISSLETFLDRKNIAREMLVFAGDYRAPVKQEDDK